MSVQVPPNSSGSVIETLTSSTKTLNLGERQGVYIAPGGHPTYSAAYIAQSAGTSATTEIFNLIGASAVTVRCCQIVANVTQTTAGQEYDLAIQKNSALATGGTKATAATIAPWDSNDAAASATTAFYTATPTGGTSVGLLFATKWSAFIATATTVVNQVLPLIINFGVLPGARLPTLRGATQAVALTISTATPGNANSWDISCVWTETTGD